MIGFSVLLGSICVEQCNDCKYNVCSPIHIHIFILFIYCLLLKFCYRQYVVLCMLITVVYWVLAFHIII